MPSLASLPYVFPSSFRISAIAPALALMTSAATAAEPSRRDARLTLIRHPGQTRNLRVGQTLQVPAGATRIPEPTEIDLDRLMKTSPLIIGFRPLPNQNLINNAIRNQQQRGPFNQPNRNAPSGPQKAPAPQAPVPPSAPGPR